MCNSTNGVAIILLTIFSEREPYLVNIDIDFHGVHLILLSCGGVGYTTAMINLFAVTAES